MNNVFLIRYTIFGFLTTTATFWAFYVFNNATPHSGVWIQTGIFSFCCALMSIISLIIVLSTIYDDKCSLS
jgi:uncharacterized protein YhhL (DUF1145 family)